MAMFLQRGMGRGLRGCQARALGEPRFWGDRMALRNTVGDVHSSWRRNGKKKQCQFIIGIEEEMVEVSEMLNR